MGDERVVEGDAAKMEAGAEDVEPSKAELQRRLEETRESISQTVNEIKETVTDQYESVKETVTGVLDYREHFQQEPLMWSVGALSAGFALGYTLGYAHKSTHTSHHKQSQLAAFADGLIDELSGLGKSLIMPSLNSKIRELFGFDFSEMLEEMSHARHASADEPPKKKTLKGSARKNTQKSAKKSLTKKTTKGRVAAGRDAPQSVSRKTGVRKSTAKKRGAK